MKKTDMNDGLKYTSLVVLITAMIVYSGCTKPNRNNPNHIPDIDIELFTMPMCPYGAEALKNILDIAKNTNKISLHVYYIAETTGEENNLSLQSFQSLHGADEVLAGIIAVVVENFFPEKYMSFLENSVLYPEKRWEEWADFTRSELEMLAASLQTEDALYLYAENISESQKKSIKRSPTIFINGEKYEASAQKDYLKRAVCHISSGENLILPACQNVPECVSNSECHAIEGALGVCEDGKCVNVFEPPITLTILSSELIDPIHLEQTEKKLKKLVPSIIENATVYIGSDYGKTLAKELGVHTLPVFIFGPNVESCINYKSLLKLGLKKSPEEIFILEGTPLAHPFRSYGKIYYDPNSRVVYDLPLDVQASALHAVGKIQEAEILYESHIEENPDDVRAMMNLGTLFAENGNLGLAMEYYKRVIKIKPDYRLVYENLRRLCEQLDDKKCEVYALIENGWELYNQNSYKESITQFQAALNIDNAASGALVGIGRAYMDLGYYEEAREYIERAEYYEPDDSQITNILAGILYRTGRYSEAINKYQVAAGLDYDNVTIQINLAKALQTIGDNKTAIKSLENASEKCKADPEFIAKLVELYCEVKEYGSAMETGNNFLDSNPGSVDLLYWTAIAEMQIGLIDSARNKLINAASITGENIELTFQLAEAFVELGMKTYALEMINKILDIFPGHGPSHAYYSLLVSDNITLALDHAELVPFPVIEFRDFS